MRQFITHGPSSSLLREWREDLYIAFAFLTRLPLPAPESVDQAAFTRALRLSPVVGSFVGAIAGSFYWLGLSYNLSSFISALIGVGVAALLTGGLHEDGLSDTIDGLSGGWTRERRLEIMSDSHIGAHGVFALILVTLLRAGCMAQLANPGTVMAALIAAGALSRAIMYGAMGLLPRAKEEGLAHIAGQPLPRQVAVAAALGFALAVLAVPFDLGVSALLAATIGGAGTGVLAKWKIGGKTGDILGAIQVISEIFALICLASALTD